MKLIDILFEAVKDEFINGGGKKTAENTIKRLTLKYPDIDFTNVELKRDKNSLVYLRNYICKSHPEVSQDEWVNASKNGILCKQCLKNRLTNKKPSSPDVYKERLKKRYPLYDWSKVTIVPNNYTIPGTGEVIFVPNISGVICHLHGEPHVSTKVIPYNRLPSGDKYTKYKRGVETPTGVICDLCGKENEEKEKIRMSDLGKKSSERQKFSVEKIQELLLQKEKTKYLVLDFDDVFNNGVKTTIDVKKKGKEMVTAFFNIKCLNHEIPFVFGEDGITQPHLIEGTTGCPKCLNNKKTNYFKNTIVSLFGEDRFDLSKVDYNNKNYIIKDKDNLAIGYKFPIGCLKNPTHPEFYPKSTAFLQGSVGCPRCNETDGESVIYEYLKIRYPDMKSQYNGFIDLYKKKTILGNPHRLVCDFYVPSIKTIIEYDGPTHFMSFYKGRNIDNIVGSDITKNNYVLNKVNTKEVSRIIRISYLTKIKNVANELDRLLNINEPLVLSNNYPNEGWNK
jgi:very-short-patch-repair endonuclease